MNKNDLIGAVAETSGLSKSQAASAVESVFDSISSALKKGDEVRLVGFGTFSVAKRKASTGRNPRTGEPMAIKASKQPKFKAGKGLKDSVHYAPPALGQGAATPGRAGRLRRFTTSGWPPHRARRRRRWRR